MRATGRRLRISAKRSKPTTIRSCKQKIRPADQSAPSPIYRCRLIDTGPTWHWLIGTDLGFQKFWGPGAENSFDGVRGGVINTAIDKSTPLTDYTASFNGSVLPASVSEIFDSGITNADTTTMTYAGQGGLTHHLNDLNSLGLICVGGVASLHGWKPGWPHAQHVSDDRAILDSHVDAADRLNDSSKHCLVYGGWRLWHG